MNSQSNQPRLFGPQPLDVPQVAPQPDPPRPLSELGRLGLWLGLDVLLLLGWLSLWLALLPVFQFTAMLLGLAGVLGLSAFGGVVLLALVEEVRRLRRADERHNQQQYLERYTQETMLWAQRQVMGHYSRSPAPKPDTRYVLLRGMGVDQAAAPPEVVGGRARVDPQPDDVSTRRMSNADLELPRPVFKHWTPAMQAMWTLRAQAVDPSFEVCRKMGISRSEWERGTAEYIRTGYLLRGGHGRPNKWSTP